MYFFGPIRNKAKTNRDWVRVFPRLASAAYFVLLLVYSFINICCDWLDSIPFRQSNDVTKPSFLTFLEFLDPKDPSLAFAVYGASQLNIFPIAVLDVSTAGSKNEELLLCFNGKLFRLRAVIL